MSFSGNAAAEDQPPTVAGWTVGFSDEYGGRYLPTWCEIGPEGLFATVRAPGALRSGERVILEFGSGELRVEVGATVAYISSIGSHGIAMLLAVDRLCGTLIESVARGNLLAS